MSLLLVTQVFLILQRADLLLLLLANFVKFDSLHFRLLIQCFSLIAVKTLNAYFKQYVLICKRVESDMDGGDGRNTRLQNYKNKGIDSEELRRRREDESVQLRKQKREDQVSMSQTDKQNS